MQVEVLKTPYEKALGLQFRDYIPDDYILLFENMSPGSQFHMRNCKFPISIVSLDKENQILDIGFMEPDVGNYQTPDGTFSVIEANEGFWEAHGFSNGDFFYFEEVPKANVRLSNKRNAQISSWINGLKEKYFSSSDDDKSEIMKGLLTSIGIVGVSLLLGLGIRELKESDLLKKMDPKDKIVYQQAKEDVVQGNGSSVQPPLILPQKTQISPKTPQMVQKSPQTPKKPVQVDRRKVQNVPRVVEQPKTVQPQKKAPSGGLQSHLIEHADKNNLDPGLVARIIKQESKFDPYAKSHKGARGLMQITPRTWRAMTKELGVPWKFSEAYDPYKNIVVGTYYLGQLSNWVNDNPKLRGHKHELLLSAYNAGQGNVKKYRGVPPFRETRNYIRKILRRGIRYVAEA